MYIYYNPPIIPGSLVKQSRCHDPRALLTELWGRGAFTLILERVFLATVTGEFRSPAIAIERYRYQILIAQLKT